jgi:hypothetical protein
MAIRSISQIDTLAELKSFDVSSWDDSNRSGMYLVSKSGGVVDNLGGLYQWDPLSTAAEDLTNLNVIKSNSTNTGRWIRGLQRAMAYPQGILVNNGGVKTLYVSATTNSSGEAQIYLTTDNTANGPLIFSEVYTNNSHAKVDASNLTQMVMSFVKVSAETGNLKSTTHGFYKMNMINILLGGTVAPLVMIGAGTNVIFEITGI